MRLVHFPTHITILLDVLAWFIIHLSVSYLGVWLPDRWFAQDKGIYRLRGWEREGAVYRDLLRIRTWKKWLPDGGGFFPQGFGKRKLQSKDRCYLDRFILETRRAELTHWLQILPVGFFFLWNEWWVGILMVVYALSVNLPCIIAQRYNRPRLQKYYQSQR